jgi:hypothetical protein
MQNEEEIDGWVDGWKWTEPRAVRVSRRIFLGIERVRRGDTQRRERTASLSVFPLSLPFRPGGGWIWRVLRAGCGGCVADVGVRRVGRGCRVFAVTGRRGWKVALLRGKKEGDDTHY